MCFHCQYSYLENFKCSWRATLKCLAGRMWPADRTLPRPALRGKWSRHCHQITHGLGRGSTKVSRDIFYLFLNNNFKVFIAKKKFIFWKIKNVTSRLVMGGRGAGGLVQVSPKEIGCLVLGLSQFSLLPQLPQKTILNLKEVKFDSKIIISHR